MVQNGPHEHAGAQPCRVAVGFMQGDRIRVFNITNYFPQKYGLNYSGAFLKGKKKKKGLIRNASSTDFLNTNFYYSHVKKTFWQNAIFRAKLKKNIYADALFSIRHETIVLTLRIILHSKTIKPWHIVLSTLWMLNKYYKQCFRTHFSK